MLSKIMMKTQSATEVSGIDTCQKTIELSNKKRRLFEITRAVALASPGVGGRNGNNFRLGAVLVSGRRVVASDCNSLQFSRVALWKYKFPFRHAESAAISRIGLDACSNLDLYVARVKRNGELALAKPCDECMRLIEIAGIRNVYYSVGPDQYAKI
jgi:tRNA(Arg) A34 adenosine deaminase TadA